MSGNYLRNSFDFRLEIDVKKESRHGTGEFISENYMAMCEWGREATVNKNKKGTKRNEDS